MKVRVVSLDFYMANPIPNLDILYSEFRGSSVNNVPVIRIYGSTESGEKICLHVHRVFPYIYIPHDGETRVDGFLYQVASALDKAINSSLGQASSSVQHVYKVCLVSGNPLYGYHARPHQFLRLYFYNPLIVKKACTLLQNGNILGKIYQAHEAHIPYILQFMMDYNLHGMSHIHLADLKYRYDQYSHDKYPENSVLPPSIRKMSTCKLEADTTGDCVLNREEITLGMLTANPGIKALWEDEAQRRRNNKEPSQIEHCLTQNRLDVPQTATHVAYKKLLDEKLTMKSKSSHVSPQLELSVYPAETPPSSDVLDASIVENHIFSSQSTDDSSILDQTITENLQSDTANLIDFTLDANAQELLDVLQRMREDNIDKDSILSQVQKEQGSDDEDPDLSLPLNATQTPSKLDEEANKKNVEDFLKNSYFESLAKIPQLDGTWEDDSSLEKDSKQRKEEKKRNIKKKTSEFYQPTIPKPKKLNGSGVGKKGRGRKRTFRIKTSAVFPKSRSKFSRAGHCMYCTNCKSDTTTSKKNVSPCLRHYFRNIKNTPNTQEKNCNLEDIESSINKVIENICKELDQNKTPTLATKDRVQFQTGTSNKEILQNQQPIQPWKNCRRKKTKMTMCTEESKENMNVVLLEGDMEVNKFDAENIKISHDLENHQKSNDLVEERMDFKLQNYTLDDAKVLNQIVNAGDAQKIVSKPVSEGNITPKNKRKSYPIKRIIPTAKVPKKSDTIKLTKNLVKCNLNEKAKDSLSRCSSCKESAENQVKEATMKSKTIKMIAKKTTSPKKATIFAGDLQNSGNSGVQTLQTPETLIDITLPNLKQQVNEESENIVVHTILAIEDLKQVLPIRMEEDAPNSDQAASLPEPIEQIQKNDLSTASDQVITERERIEESSGTEPKEKSQNQEERNKIGEISTIPSNLLFVGQKVNGELREEEVQIKNLPEQEQPVREEVIKMPIITSNVEEFTNIIDPVKAETQNKIFEKCEQFLDMPPLSNSSSNKYDKKGSFEMHDDNNNTQINNFQSYFRDEKLEVKVEDQHDKDKEIKSLTNEVQGVDIVNKLIGSRPTNVTSSEVTNKNPKCSKKLSKSSPSKDVGKNSDINNKLKLGKGKRSKCRQKNKHAQTDSTPTVVHRRGRGRPLEVAANLIVTPSINKYDYKAQIRYFNRKYIPKHNLLAKYNLTPDFRPKFRVVQGYTPYPFEPRMMYPNTTWTRCIESGGLASNSCAEIGVQTDAPNSAITISDRLLEGEEKFENSQIEKGQVVKAIKSSIPKNLKLKIPGEIELMGTDKTETQNSGWSSQELRNVDDLCNLYDGLKELGVFSPENSSRGISKVFQSTTNTEKISQEHVLEGNRLYSGDKTSLETPNSDTSSRCSLSKVFQSIAGIQTPDQVEEHVLEGKKLYSGDKTSLETPDSDISSSYSLSKVLQLITDIQTPDQVDGANIPKFLRNYREDMKNREHNLMEKMRQSWNDHAASTASIIEGCCISGCRILENLKESTGQGDAKTLVGRRSEEIGTKLRSTGNCEVDPNASTNKYSKDEGKTSTLQGDENEIKDVPGLQNKGDGAKTGENKNIETTHFPLPTNNLGDHSLKPPSADSNELNDRSCTIFSQTNQRLSNASHTSTSTPSTIPKILYSSNSKSKDSLPGNSRKTGKPKKIPSLFNNSKILFENRDRPKEDLPLNHDLRLSDINSNDPPLAIQSNPLEDLKSLLKKNGSYVITNLTNHSFPNMSHRDKPAPSVASTSLPCTNAECNRISRKNSKESAEKLDFFENPKSSIQNQYQLKEDSKPSKITPNITKRPKHFKKEEYQGERVLKIPVSIDRSAISCNLGTSSEENVILSLSSVVNPSLLSKQDLHDAINSNRGKNLEADKKIRFKPVETDRASSANTSTSRSRKRRNKNEEKVGSVSIPAPCCSSSLVGTPKTSKKTKRSKKKDVSNQESAFQAIPPKNSFAKPTDELNFGILKSSIPKHLKNDYQNPEDLLTMLLQNSEPINHKKDIDERAIIYDLLKKKLELSRTNQCPALKCELQRECSVYLRRYNFTSIRSAQFSRDSFKAKGSCKQDTSYQLTPLANEDFDANNYVADLNNNSKSALKIGSAVGKAPKRKIKKKKGSKEDEMDSFPVNQFRYLDGPNDSSSDGEEAIKPTPKKVCRQSRKAFPSSAKYSPLKVNFGSPSKKSLTGCRENSTNTYTTRRPSRERRVQSPSISQQKIALSAGSNPKTDYAKCVCPSRKTPASFCMTKQGCSNGITTKQE